MIFRVQKQKRYTVMSNYHFSDNNLTLKAKGLLSQMLSLPENWDYSLRGLAAINREGIDAIRTGILELERYGYVVRRQTRDEKGQYNKTVYDVYEMPNPDPTPLENENKDQSQSDDPCSENPNTDNLISENPTQLITNQNKELKKLNYTKEKKDLLKIEVSKQAPQASEKTRPSFNEIIDKFTTSADLRNSLKEWIRMRCNIGKRPTNRGLELALIKLEQSTNGNIEQMIEVTESAIINNWIDLRVTKFNVMTPQNVVGKRVSAQNYDQRTYSDEELNSLMADIASLGDDDDDFALGAR